MTIKISESRTPTLGTLSMNLLEVDSFKNSYYNIFNNTAIIYIGMLQYLTVHWVYMIHRLSRSTTLTVYVYSSFLFFVLAKVATTLLKSKFSENSFSIISID